MVTFSWELGWPQTSKSPPSLPYTGVSLLSFHMVPCPCPVCPSFSFHGGRLPKEREKAKGPRPFKPTPGMGTESFPPYSLCQGKPRGQSQVQGRGPRPSAFWEEYRTGSGKEKLLAAAFGRAHSLSHVACHAPASPGDWPLLGLALQWHASGWWLRRLLGHLLTPFEIQLCVIVRCLIPKPLSSELIVPPLPWLDFQPCPRALQLTVVLASGKHQSLSSMAKTRLHSQQAESPWQTIRLAP